ncbi:MAG TPA: right-handed parallel beta-helix repeat-containing protein [Candidatus Hydrogenedens sp.]|nr:right-handed parallel beta-helix repeat-containing protein [Candidatus Hydrogenedens sp.]
MKKQVRRKRGFESYYVKRKLSAGIPVIFLMIFLTLHSATNAQVVIHPGDNIVDIISNNPAETTFHIEADTTTPTIYNIEQPIIVNRDITLVGVPNSASPSNPILPTDIVIAGDNVFEGVVGNGNFEETSMTDWNIQLEPPDPGDPGYSIIEQNSLALSPTHLALFKGVNQNTLPEQIHQNFQFTEDPLSGDPYLIAGYPEIWQNITFPIVSTVVDILETQPIDFPKGTEPTGISYIENTLPLSAELPLDLPNLVSAQLRFEIMRSADPVNLDDRVEIYIKMLNENRIFTIPLSAIASPMMWVSWNFDITSLIQQYNPGDTPDVEIRISKLGIGENTVYLDDFRVFLDMGFITTEIPIFCGSFDNIGCGGWTGEGNWRIDNDPLGPPLDRCLIMGPSPVSPREVWVEMFVKTKVFSGKATDMLRFSFDGMLMPTQIFAEVTPGDWVPIPEYRPNLIPNAEDYTRILVKIPSPLTNDNVKHVFHIESQVSPCALTPESIDFNTTTFDIDDVRFLVGPLANLKLPENGISIPNGDFESGNDGSWIFVTNPVIPGRDIATVIKTIGGNIAPSCSELGGVPPAKLSFQVKPVNVDGSQDFFKVWLDDDENIATKIVYDSRISGMPSDGVWTKIERWLVPPLLEEGISSFSLHVKAKVFSLNPGSYILFDDFCVSPYGGLGILIDPFGVCPDNAVQNPSFETNPDSAWNKNATALLMGPIHCYDMAYPVDCILPEPPITGTRALRFGAVNPVPILSFWLKILNATSTSDTKLEIVIDDQVIKTINANDTFYWNNYALVMIDNELLPFLDMQMHSLTIRISAGECNKSPVRFLIDDVCLGYEILMPGPSLVCLNNIILDAGFESGLSTPWDANPDKSQIIQGGPTGFIDAHTGAWYARLEGPKPDTRILSKSGILIPPSATILRFYVYVEKGSLPEQTTLKVYWDDIAGTPVWVKDAESFEEGKWILQEVPLSSLDFGPHTLYFVYENCRFLDHSIIMIDDVAIARNKFPLIEVQPNGNLCVENLSLTRGSAGILNTGGTSKVYRCFLGPHLDDGIVVMSNGTASISQTVIHGNSNDGVLNNGLTAILQSTIRSNGGIGVESKGTANTYVMASLIWENATGGLINDTGASLVSGWNLVYPLSTTDVTEVGNPITINPLSVHFLDNPWLGKLLTPIPARVPLQSILNQIPSILTPYLSQSSCSNAPYVDFENEVRDILNLQVSADEVSILGTELLWVYCKVNPVVPRSVTGRERDIGIGNTFTVEVGIQGNYTLNDATLYLVPEEYVSRVTNAPDPLLQINKLPAELKQVVTPIDTTLQKGRSVFPIDSLFLSDGDGILFTTNGRARLYLRVNQILIGIATVNDYRIRFNSEDTEFVVDTVQPRLRGDLYDATAAGFVVQNNDVVSPPTQFSYPPNWGPALLNPLAYSYGTISNGTEPTAQIFFNNQPQTGLAFVLQPAYYDPYPEYNGVPRIVEVSGFINNRSNISASTVTPIMDLITNGPVFPGFEPYRGLGCAFIAPLNDISRILSYASNPVVEYLATADPSQPGLTQPWQTALVQWRWLNLIFGPDWHIRMKFLIKDLSGNIISENPIQQDALELWWMRDPVLDITSAPRTGSWDKNPKIQWRLIRSVSDKPVNSDPCLPIYGIRLWSAIDPFNYETSIWEVVDRFVNRWGWIINRESMDKNTPIVFSDGTITTLNDIMNDSHYCGALLMATIIGADESGNVQPVPNVLLGNRFNSLGTVTGNNIPFCIWRNPCEFDIDTKLDINSWWNNTTAHPSTWREVNYNFGEREFGASRRIPLPALEDACNYRIEIKLNMSCILPSEGFVTGRRGFDVQIFEDSNLVAAGTVMMTYGDTNAEIYIPTDILSPRNDSSNFTLNWYNLNPDFLNNPPTICNLSTSDRLGDEGSPAGGFRKREVKYDIVVRAFVQDMATGALVTDSTPAKTTVTIYPPTGGKERSVTAPSQPKEEQRIKMFQRE